MTGPKKEIRVYLVDDSPVALAVLRKILDPVPDIQVVGTATSGTTALKEIPDTKPDVVCTDLNMPGIDGFELTRQLMEQHPVPILIVSVAVQKNDQQTVFELLKSGAVDVVAKPKAGLSPQSPDIGREIIQKIRVASGVVAFHRFRRDRREATAPKPPVVRRGGNPRVLAVGASTGGPQALQTLFRAFPADLPVPVLCVQHISQGFLKGLLDWLATQSALQFRIATSGETMRPGVVYFPPEDRHLQVSAEGTLRASNQDLYHGFRPSVTVLFSSVAKAYGGESAAVLLTGMGDDGAAGMKEIHDAGGTTIAQDEATCTVFGMPKEAIRIGAAQSVRALRDIPGAILELLRR